MASTATTAEDGDALASPSPSPAASFVLLEARDSHDDHATNPPRPQAAATTRAAQRSPPDREQYNAYCEHAGARVAPPPRSSISFQHRAAPPLAPQPRARADSLHDLFPLMNSSVFTTPDNIMPSLQDAIVIDDGHDALSSYHGAAGGGGLVTNAAAGASSTGAGLGSLTVGNVTLAQSSLAGNQLSLGAIFGAAAASVGRAGIASARDPSCHSFADLDESTSGDSFTEALHTGGASARPRATPAQWLASLSRRLHANWDSTFLLSTLLVSVAVVPLAVVVAAVLKARVGATYTARCQLPFSRDEHTFEVSTASFATITIPALNHVVFFVVSLWIGVSCSRSRTRVLRSHAQSSARTNLTSAFMLPCYEAIWYMIAILSAVGVVLYGVSYQEVSPVDGGAEGVADAAATVAVLPSFDDAVYPCNVTSLPLVWIFQLLPMLMTQRSVSQEAVVRSIVYSGAVCVVMLVLFMSLYHQGRLAILAISIAVDALLFGFYLYAKLVFRARSTFDFFFVSGVVGVIASLAVQLLDIGGMRGTHAVFIGYCVVNSLYALTPVALLLSLRADTRYWLGIDDGSAPTRNPMRQYMRQLSERGMIINFSTRTSVYDVHRMIEEHRKSVVDFSALKLDGIIAQGATSIVMRGVLRGGTDIALKIYTSVQVTDEELHRFSRETALNVQLSHPNVVRFYGLCVVPPSISLVFEFCEYGGLDVALRNSSLWVLSTKLKAWLDACKAVAYLHSFSPPLLHRDVKTDNFLLGQDYMLKLADFGEANLLRPRTDGTMTIAGTVDYMAPEMILGGKTARYGTAVDTYSLMITLWQIMVPDRSPWEGKTHLEVYRSVKSGERPPLLPSIPEGCAEILESGWAANPFERVAVDELIPKVHRLWLRSLHQKMLKRTK